MLGEIIAPKTLKWSPAESRETPFYNPFISPGEAERDRAEKIRKYWSDRGVDVTIELSSFHPYGRGYMVWTTRSNITEAICRKSTG